MTLDITKGRDSTGATAIVFNFERDGGKLILVSGDELRAALRESGHEELFDDAHRSIVAFNHERIFNDYKLRG